MNSAVKKFDRCRTSKRFCAEKLCCKSEVTEANFHCEECGTDQCVDCAASIHKGGPRFEYHEQKEIIPPSPDQLCQISFTQSNRACLKVNYPDIHCEICNLNFCFNCFDIHHKLPPRKTHKKIFYREYRQRETQKKLDNTIKPISPVSIDDNSLTFVSCPQLREDFYETSSMDSYKSVNSKQSPGSSIPDLCLDSLSSQHSSLIAELAESQIEDACNSVNVQSFELLDDQENLKVENVNDFVESLGCDSEEMVKVVSIFGNTGDGKSYTLNHTFFHGKEVFKTSAHQVSCTIGVWAAYDSRTNVVVIDTEGLLGLTANQNQRSRLLLKVLAVSDVIIFRTRAERLHNDMFQFLCDASSAYTKHFSTELEAAAKKAGKTISDLTPSVVIFHETTNTDPLGTHEGKSAENILWERFSHMNCGMQFKDLIYVGTRTRKGPTDFSKFHKVMCQQLQNKSHRAARKPEIIYATLKKLNEKFSGDIERPVYGTFPDQIFTCSVKCLSCGEGCCRSMNHCTEAEPHSTDKRCKYQHQYGNKVYLCKGCWLTGIENIVVPKTSESNDNVWMGFAKYVWSGEVLECPSCGVIFRSRANWYGNKEAEDVVSIEIKHVWPDGYQMLQGAQNAARKVVEGFHYIADSISSVGAKPTKMLTDWMTDSIAPEYWVPNAQITMCHLCKKKLENEQKHHCRACGNGFCDSCSSHKRPVPERGWGEEFAVRVCDNCFNTRTADKMNGSCDSGKQNTNTARKMGEAVSSALGVAAFTLNYPLGMIKDSARPAYWIPDSEIKQCIVCDQEFNSKLKIHHCRACGNGVCENCSPNKRPVHIRGWDYPVRVCKKCENKTDKL